eukprot:4954029-Amphidinium_carterae.2
MSEPSLCNGCPRLIGRCTNANKRERQETPVNRNWRTLALGDNCEFANHAPLVSPVGFEP